MKVKPLIGIDELKLGSSKVEVLKLLGMYNLSKLDEFGGNQNSEIWYYPELGFIEFHNKSSEHFDGAKQLKHLAEQVDEYFAGTTP